MTKYRPNRGHVISLVDSGNKRRYLLVLTESKLNAATKSFVVAGMSEQANNPNLSVKVNVQGTDMFVNAHQLYTLPLKSPEYICDINVAQLNNLLVKITQLIGAGPALEPYIK